MTKIIFLDIDGVLNSRALQEQQFEKYKLTGNKRKFPEEDINHEACMVLKEIVKETNAKVVISSTWRFNYYDFLVKHLASYKIEVIGKTKRGCADCVRGNEILAWIQDNKDVVGVSYQDYKNYVILDDDSDMLYWQKDNFVKINNDFGLTDGYKDSIISILNQ